MNNQKFNPVVWFEIYVEDIDRATKFYETVFDIQLRDMSNPADDSMQMRGFPSADFNFGASGALVKMKGLKPSGVSSVVYFGSADCSVEESRVVNAGGKVFKSKLSIGEHGFMSLINDTEGNMVGIHSMT